MTDDDSSGEPTDILHALKYRLTKGFGSSADKDREHYFTGDSSDDGSIALNRLVATIENISSDFDETAVSSVVDLVEHEIARQNTLHPALVRTIVHHPEQVVTAAEKQSPDYPQEHAWQVSALCAEATWAFLESRAHALRIEHIVPWAARSRFLILSEPFRCSPESAYWTGGNNTAASPIRLVFEPDGTAEFIRRARQARRIWGEHLDSYQSVPGFAAAQPFALELELKWVAAVGNSWGKGLSFTESREVLPSDLAFSDHVIERHLLPRFALWSAFCAVVGRLRWPAHCTYALLVALALVSIGNFVFRGSLWPSVILAGATYAVIGLGAVFFPRRWTMPLLMRMPAAAAVGIMLAVSLHPDWWDKAGANLLYAAAAIATAACGYLVLQCRNHCTGELSWARKKEPEPEWQEQRRQKTEGKRSLRGALQRVAAYSATAANAERPAVWVCIRLFALRPLLVVTIGLGHAFLVALIGLAVVSPVFSEHGSTGTVLSVLAGGGTEAASVLAAATAWCLAAGVFSQILWDDQPITAPLAHQRWRRT